MIFRPRRVSTILSATCCAVALMLPALASARPKKVVSINLCTDQLLLALADREQIAGVSGGARNVALSFLAAKALKYPRAGSNTESLFESRPDLLLMGAFDKRHLRVTFRSRGIRMLVLEPWGSLEHGLGQIRRVALTLGQTPRGDALIAEISAALAKLRAMSAAGRTGKPYTFLPLERRGHVSQEGIVSELAEIAGLVNAGAGNEGYAGRVISLEVIVTLRPDYLILSGAIARPEDQGQAKLIHPALRRLYPPSRRFYVPDRLSICAGPSTPALIRHIISELKRKLP